MRKAEDYAGDISAEDAYEFLHAGNAVLVDVRTRAEWLYVGAPDLSSIPAEPIFLEWQEYPSMAVVQGFPAVLAGKLAERRIPMEANILFLCRSGVRSLAAAKAMTAIGYPNCFNISGGFEGPSDEKRQRGRVDGWKARGLPWTQP